VEVEEKEQPIDFVLDFIFFVQTTRLTNTFVDMFGDGNRWTKICSKMQFNHGLTNSQNK
jgi:hypothetical protein